MDRSTQNAKIINYFKEHGNATIRDIFIHCNINSPRKRISELISAGYPITSIWEENITDGEKVRYKRFFLDKAKEMQ